LLAERSHHKGPATTTTTKLPSFIAQPLHPDRAWRKSRRSDPIGPAEPLIFSARFNPGIARFSAVFKQLLRVKSMNPRV
jgi:hypothetical protein